mgnify:CR=1 FL=1
MKTCFLAIERRLTALIIVIACLLLGIASTLGMYQVLTRFIFGQPSTWSEIAIRLVIIWMVMFGVVVAFREGAQVSVDLMYRLSGRYQRPLHGLILHRAGKRLLNLGQVAVQVDAGLIQRRTIDSLGLRRNNTRGVVI